MDEVDPAADAGVGAQALLGLAAGNTVRLPCLTNLPGGLSRHAAQAQDAASLLARAPSPPSHTLNVYHCASETPLELVQHLASSREQVHNEAQPQEAEQEVIRSKAPIPRLPSLSSSDSRNRKDSHRAATSEPKPSASPHLSIPRLASIAEWATPRAQSVHAPVGALPRLQHPLHLNSIPALPSLPSQTQSDCAPPQPWTTTALQSLHAPFSTPPPHVTPEWPPRPASLVYTHPPHHPEVPSYYPYSGPAQYSHHPTSLPQLRPHPAPLQIPQYVGSRSIESPAVRSSSSLDQHPYQNTAVGAFGAQSVSGNALLQIVNGVSKNVPDEPCGQRASSDSVSTHAASNRAEKSSSPPLAPSVHIDELNQNKPTRKTLFASSSSGRGIVDLMNPTDTLAAVASAIGPLPIEDARVESPNEAQNASSAKMKMARQIFGSGNEVSRSRGKESGLRRKKSLDRKEGVLPAQSSMNRETTRDDSNAIPLKERTNGREDRKTDLDGRSSINSLKNDRRRVSLKERRTERPTESIREASRKLGKQRSQGTARSLMKCETDDNEQVVESESDSGVSEDSLASEITRCPCGSKADSGTMIACDECNTWQHRICMGFRRKSDVPRMYYCNICRPEDMRSNCVAHPKYKERQLAKDKDDQCEPILLSVKPLELRKRFSTDLRAKQSGLHLTHTEVFMRYAHLYRTQFGKDRQSVIEGLVVLTEIRREDVVGRLENAIKKSKMSNSLDNFEILNGDRSERRKHSHATSASTISLSAQMNGSHAHPRQSQKRTRPSPAVHDSAVLQLESAKAYSGSISPEKELSSGERNRLSREERKMKQVMTLFKRLEERDKKRPRLGEHTGSPRNSSVSSPRPLSSPVLRGAYSPKSPTRNLRLSPLPEPMRDRLLSPTPEKRKHMPSNPVPTEERVLATSMSTPLPKRERSSKDRKDSRRRESRDSRSSAPQATADGGRKHGIFPRRRERQVLSSVGLRQRGISKSELRVEAKEIDPTLLFKVKVPGPSVLGSKLIPLSRRSAMDNEAENQERVALQQNDLGVSKRLDKKKWLLSSALADFADADDRTKAHRPFRKRSNTYLYEESSSAKLHVLQSQQVASPRLKKEVPSVSMIVVSKREALPDGGKKLERSLMVEALEEEDSPSNIAVQPLLISRRSALFSVKKRESMRPVSADRLGLNPGVSGSPKKPRYISEVAEVCFKKRMLVNISANVLFHTTKAVSVMETKEPKYHFNEVKECAWPESPKPTSFGSATGSRLVASDIKPKCDLQAAIGIRSPPPPLRSAVIRREPNTKSPTLAAVSEVLIPSTASSPVLRSTRSPPPLRSAVINRDLNRPSLSASSSKFEQPTPKSSASSPVLPIVSSPPPLRSTKLPYLRSKPMGTSSKTLASNDKQPATSRQLSDGRSQNLALEIPMKEETTASDILQLRLKGFLSRSSDSKDGISPRGPTHGPYSHGRHPPLVPTPSVSPRAAPMSKYNTGNSWRYDSIGAPKRPHPSNGPTSGSPPISARLGMKPKQDRGAMRSLGSKLPLVNGKSPNSSTDTTPWGRYRQQNGWSGKSSSAKHTYSSVLPASNGQGSKSNGPRRKPFG